MTGIILPLEVEVVVMGALSFHIIIMEVEVVAGPPALVLVEGPHPRLASRILPTTHILTPQGALRAVISSERDREDFDTFGWSWKGCPFNSVRKMLIMTVSAILVHTYVLAGRKRKMMNGGMPTC